MYSVTESDGGLSIVTEQQREPQTKPPAENILLDPGRTQFSLDGRRMITQRMACGTDWISCYSVRASSFDSLGRFEAKWGKSGTARDLPAALRFLAGDDVELYT